LATVYAIANQKGGVGKTTTAVNLAGALARLQRRILLVDLDPQGNATMASGVNKNELEPSTYDVLMASASVAGAVVHSESGNFDLLGANSDLTAAEVELLAQKQREQRLHQALSLVQDAYDFIIIDCPPSLNMLTLNGLVAASGVIIPMQCEYFALEGLSALLDTINRVTEAVNQQLRLEGIIRTMYDPRNSLTNDVNRQLHSHFGDKIYRTVIPRNVRLAEAPSFGQPIMTYDRHSRGSLAYMALGSEVLKRAGAQRLAPRPQ
jgi:chromosome partitioning protein